jgi:hypothetical protein
VVRVDGDDGEVVSVTSALVCEKLLGLLVDEGTEDVGVGAGTEREEGVAQREGKADDGCEPPSWEALVMKSPVKNEGRGCEING